MNEDFDFRKELSSGPLKQKGFTEELRKRIEHEIDHKKRFDFNWRKLTVRTAMTFAVLFAASQVIMHLPSSKTADEAVQPNAKMLSANAVNAEAQDRLDNSLLIAFRTDKKDQEKTREVGAGTYSTYRTLFIAPQDGKMEKVAEGEGLLVPYGQKFWWLDTLAHKTDTDDIHYLSAHQAGTKASDATFDDNVNVQINHDEKVLYAGNKYIAVAESEKAFGGSTSTEYNRAWVRELKQFGELDHEFFLTDKTDLHHVSLIEVAGDEATKAVQEGQSLVKSGNSPSKVDGESWAITRKAGKWVPQLAETYASGSNNSEGYSLYPAAVSLPKSVVAHDTLSCSWEDIRKVEPKTVDAVSSPDNQWIGIITSSKFVVHRLRDGAIDPDAMLSIPLEKGEKLVMAQWATRDYLDKWVEETTKYLKDGR